ncbi:MAG: DUF427 domain-containing protein [Paracoccaceae bacterium]
MTDRIRIRKSEGTWVVRAGGAVLGESRDALELNEPGHAPLIFFPRGDIAMAFLEPSDKVSENPGKGDARYYSIQTKSELIRDAALSYEAPESALADLAGYLTFASEKVAVEQL